MAAIYSLDLARSSNAYLPVLSIMAKNSSKGQRHGHCSDKWLKEFRWLQTRGSGDDARTY